MNYRLCALLPIATFAALAASGPASAQDYKVGDIATCAGMAGPIVRIDDRPGWNDPWYVVQHKTRGSTYDMRCTASELKPAAAGAPSHGSAPAHGNPPPPPPPADQAPAEADNASLCRPGAKLEGRYGNSWYQVTVRGGPDAEGKCPVSFDGYGRMWDTAMKMDSIRARGSGHVYRPRNPVAREPERGTAPVGAMRDGRYTCHKISPGGGFQHIGFLTMRGGRGTLQGGLASWTVRSIEPMANSPRGKPMVAYYYRSAAGWNDKLDCELQ